MTTRLGKIGKSNSFGLLCMSFVNVYQTVCALFSLLVLSFGMLNLNVFLITAFPFTQRRPHCSSHEPHHVTSNNFVMAFSSFLPLTPSLQKDRYCSCYGAIFVDGCCYNRRL